MVPAVTADMVVDILPPTTAVGLLLRTFLRCANSRLARVVTADMVEDIPPQVADLFGSVTSKSLSSVVNLKSKP
jgi:hypothetical protein